jgi:hypothetical protein
MSTTLLTGMTSISLHMQWPLTSQLHGSVSLREQLFFPLRIKLHDGLRALVTYVGPSVRLVVELLVLAFGHLQSFDPAEGRASPRARLHRRLQRPIGVRCYRRRFLRRSNESSEGVFYFITDILYFMYARKYYIFFG